jgi:hypothetical protein
MRAAIAGKAGGAVLGVWLLAQPLPAAAQGSLSRAFPNGGQRGTTVSVTFAGTELPDPARLFAEGGGVEAVGPITKGVAQIRIAPDAEPGPRLLRLVGPASATSPRPFAVGSLAERLEKEPNNTPDAAESVELPVTLNGTLPSRGDLDVFRVTLRRGECLVVAGESRALGAPTNLLVRIRNAAGLALATQMDYRTRDPLLGFTAPEDGDYLVELQDVLNNYSNIDANYVYRVTLTRGPWLDAPYPPGARRSAATPIAFSGWNLGGRNGPTSVTEVVAVPAEAGERLTVSAGGAPNRVALVLGDAPEADEGEGQPPAAPRVPPITINGRFAARGDRDAFPFTAAAGQRLAFDVAAREIGSFADAVLQIQDAAGKTLASADDADRGRDPYLVWTAPAAGVYTVVLRDLAGNSRGGPEFIYRLTVAAPTPELRLTTPSPTVILKAGGQAGLPVTVNARNVGEEIRVEAVDLPAGLSADPQTAGNTSGRREARLTLRATPDTAPGAYGIRIRGTTGTTTTTAQAGWVLSTDRSGTLAEGATERILVVIPAP